MAWEMQGPGLVFGETVTQKLNYLNVYLRSQETSLERKVSDEPGWVPTSGNKTQLLEDYRKALETREFVNHSAEALRECHQFRYDQGGNVVHDKEQCDEESGARVSHGDYVIADALAWKIAKMAGCNRLSHRKKEEHVPLFSPLGLRQYRERMARREEQLEEAWWR